MGKVIKMIISGRYKTIDSFWNEYCKTYTKKLSSSYRNKLWGGQREIPRDMLKNIYELLGITNFDVTLMLYHIVEIHKVK